MLIEGEDGWWLYLRIYLSKKGKVIIVLGISMSVFLYTVCDVNAQ